MRQLILSVLLWACCLAPGVAVAETPFAPGQVWTLSDKAFPDALITIDKVETWNGRPIVHISVTNLPPAAGITTVAHMPFADSALRASVGTLVQADGQPFAGFQDGYRQWQDAKGGVYTITVGKALQLAIGMLRGGDAPPPDGKASGVAN